jgi:SAM-dependent methyltransferase
MEAGHMRRFWDARAREDAFYFVDSRSQYGGPNTERFWDSGDETLAAFEARLGVAVSPEDVVLDVGCGLGRITRALAVRSREVLALDISADMLAQAEELNAHLDNVKWLLGDGISLQPVGTSSVDVLVSFVVFQHIPDPAITLGYIREMGRVLRPGGWAAFQVSNDPQLHARWSQRPSMRRRLATLLGRAPRGQTDPAWVGSAIDLDELAATAADAGLDVEHVDGAGTLFCFVLLRRRRERDEAQPPSRSS